MYSLKEKIAQSVVMHCRRPETYGGYNVGCVYIGGEIIRDGEEGIERTKTVAQGFRDKMTDTPLLFVSDFENGCGSMVKGLTDMPRNMGLGAADSEKLAYEYGKATALEAKLVGANWSFSPVCDLNFNPRNPITNTRSLGDDVNRASALVTQIIKGMQDHGLAACAKHFPGDGMDWRDQHIVTTSNSLSYEDWLKHSGKMFKDAIDAGVYSIMAGHITFDAYQKIVAPNGRHYPATLSEELLGNLLKKEMGFKGVITSDGINMGGFNRFYNDPRRGAVECYKAGCDMLLWPSDTFIDDVYDAVKNGYISEERVDDAFNRVMEMKEKLGLFDKKYDVPLNKKETISYAQNVRKEICENSITLIKDREHILPIKKDVKRISIVNISNWDASYESDKILEEELLSCGYEVTRYERAHNVWWEQYFKDIDSKSDLIIYTLYCDTWKPMGPIDFTGDAAMIMKESTEVAADKSVYVSFGNPYLGEQYCEKESTYINAYSPNAETVRAFARAICGKIPFGTHSPVNLKGKIKTVIDI